MVYFLEFSKKTTNSGIIPENRTCCEQVEERAEIERHKVKNPHLNYKGYRMESHHKQILNQNQFQGQWIGDGIDGLLWDNLSPTHNP